VVKFDFSHSKLRKQYFFAENFKIQGEALPPPFRRPCSQFLYRICARGAKRDPPPHWKNAESLWSLLKIWKVLD